MFNFNQNKSQFPNNNMFQNWNNNKNYNNKNNPFNFSQQNNQYFPNNINTNINNNEGLFRTTYRTDYNSQKNRQYNNIAYNNKQIKQHYDSLGYKFNGNKIKERNIENTGYDVNICMSIFSMPEFDHASPEEIRLCDYEKFQTGKVVTYRILNTKNNKKNTLNNMNNNIPTNQSIFNNNDLNQKKSLFTNINDIKGINLFDTSNVKQEKSLFNFDNNKQGKSIFDNNTSPFGRIIGNNNINQGSLFNDNHKTFASIFEDNKKDNKGGVFPFINFDNDKSLFNQNPFSDNNEKSMFGGEIKLNQGNNILGSVASNNPNKNPFGNEQTKIIFNQNTFENNKPLFPFGREDTEINKSKESLLDKKFNNTFNILPNITDINKQKQPNFSYGLTNIIPPTSIQNEKSSNKIQNQGLLFNNANNPQINIYNKNEKNETYNFYDNNKNITLNDIVDPFKNLSFINPIEDKDVSKTIEETVQKQKSINQFLEELEQKYENVEINENKDFLDNYGTYQDNINNYDRYENELNLVKNTQENININNYKVDDSIYNKEEFDNLKPKVNSIYEEYEKIKGQYLNKYNSNKPLNKQNWISNQKINNNNDTNRLYLNDNQNDILGRNNDLYQKNIAEIDKLINVSITVNNNLENNEKKNINQKIENVNINLDKNSGKPIKSNLFEEDEKNSSKKNQENIKIEKVESYTTLSKKNDKENNNNKEKELAPIELVPKLTKEGYKCVPSLVELSRKTKDELTKVEGFKIYNKYGAVEFKEPVNLLGLNLDEEIAIEQNLIDTGSRLDYDSIFKLYNFKVQENGLDNYKINLEKAGGNFVEYKNNEIVWEYKKKGKL